MKKTLFFGLLVFFLASCQGNEEKKAADLYADFSINMDTVMVDAGEEILMAATGYFHSYSPDLSRMYYWDFNGSKFEIVDLDQLVLLEKLDFDKEGPNGVGQNAYQMKLLQNEQLIFIGWDNKIAITDMKGEVIRRLTLDEPWMLEGLEDKGGLSFMGISEDSQKLYCGISNFKKIDTSVLEMDLSSQTKKAFSLSEFDKLDNFKVLWESEDGRGMSLSRPGMNLIKWKGQYLFWTNALNSIYRLDPNRDTLVLHRYDHRLIPNEKMGSYKNNVSSQEELQEVSAKIREEVNFTELIWDDQNQVFYRFVYMTLPKIADEETKYRSFISILNPNFELVGEKEITDLGLKMPRAQFVKDGKVYLFLNLDDELAYIRLAIV